MVPGAERGFLVRELDRSEYTCASNQILFDYKAYRISVNKKDPRVYRGNTELCLKRALQLFNVDWGQRNERAVFEQGIIHLIPRGWIRGIPRQAGSR